MRTSLDIITKINLMIVLLLIPCQAQSFANYNRIVRYDRYFSKYSKRFFGPNFDWKYFKAQAIAESRLQARAKSPTGAVGIMQIMPQTYKEILIRNGRIKGPRTHPRWNIAAGIYYNRELWRIWKARRPFQDRINFMFGSFNAGKGNVLKAQQLAAREGLNENLWKSIIRTLPAVTGRRSKETITYVEKIHTIKQVLR